MFTVRINIGLSVAIRRFSLCRAVSRQAVDKAGRAGFSQCQRIGKAPAAQDNL